MQDNLNNKNNFESHEQKCKRQIEHIKFEIENEGKSKEFALKIQEYIQKSKS